MVGPDVGVGLGASPVTFTTGGAGGMAGGVVRGLTTPELRLTGLTSAGRSPAPGAVVILVIGRGLAGTGTTFVITVGGVAAS